MCWGGLDREGPRVTQLREDRKQLVRFHAQGDAKSGLGHVVRCAILANVMADRLDVEFDCSELSRDVSDLLRTYCRPEIELINTADAPLICADNIPSIEIFDGYALDPDIISQAKNNGNLVVRIDDRAGDYTGCDLMLCHGPHAKPEMFRVDPQCRLLLGPQWALINRCFYNANAVPSKKVKRLFVSLGAGNSEQFLTQIVGDVLSLNSDIELHVVLSYANSPDTLKVLSGQHQINVHSHLTHEEMAGVMSQCDAAITAGGGTSIEAAAVGLPIILVAIAENQIAPCKEMERLGIAAYGGKLFEDGSTDNAEFSKRLAHFINDSDGRAKLIKACKEIFKNSGAECVAKEIENLSISRMTAK